MTTINLGYINRSMSPSPVLCVPDCRNVETTKAMLWSLFLPSPSPELGARTDSRVDKMFVAIAANNGTNIFPGGVVACTYKIFSQPLSEKMVYHT